MKKGASRELEEKRISSAVPSLEHHQITNCVNVNDFNINVNSNANSNVYTVSLTIVNVENQIGIWWKKCEMKSNEIKIMRESRTIGNRYGKIGFFDFSVIFRFQCEYDSLPSMYVCWVIAVLIVQRFFVILLQRSQLISSSYWSDWHSCLRQKVVPLSCESVRPHSLTHTHIRTHTHSLAHSIIHLNRRDGLQLFPFFTQNCFCWTYESTIAKRKEQQQWHRQQHKRAKSKRDHM